ncbi:hypothetical protein ACHAW5_009789 [Stephanodiscus triporus]|uniref:Myosin motor domain-containing protein n=1 Tax=Stephanodiscus triporus TaxID=2934178 RepID=A0ABD3PAQ4_9STRA
MEKGQTVWLRSPASAWGWVPAVVHDRAELVVKGVPVLELTLRDDPRFGAAAARGGVGGQQAVFQELQRSRELPSGDADGYHSPLVPFEYSFRIDRDDAASGNDDDDGALSEVKIRDDYDGHGVDRTDDLIGLAHLHEPAILHALRTRYDDDVIYTNTGPILIAINPFKRMDDLYGEEVMEVYRRGGDMAAAAAEAAVKAAKAVKKSTSRGDLRESKKRGAVVDEAAGRRLPPHVYRTANDAYRAMLRGIEMNSLAGAGGKAGGGGAGGKGKKHDDDVAAPTNQSILVSGESGAGKTVTTKFVLNYLAMLSRKVEEGEARAGIAAAAAAADEKHAEQVLQSNPILEAFGNARTIRNDNSSRFGKYIDVQFSTKGKLVGASIDTYLLEKVRLIQQTHGERNFHVFYQFLESASAEERDSYHLGDMGLDDFALVNRSGTYDRRDMVSDSDMHTEMMDAMKIMGFDQETIGDIMRVVVAILYAGNMSFSETNHGETCILDEDGASLTVADLLGVSYENLAASLTKRVLIVREGNITKNLNAKQAYKAAEGLLKSIYGANFDYIVNAINRSIRSEQQAKDKRQKDTSAYIGVLDIFGFETFQVNSFEQLCINYTNETLQQHFNQHVFKMEQQEYEREGILWKFISFPDNQDVVSVRQPKIHPKNCSRY